MTQLTATSLELLKLEIARLLDEPPQGPVLVPAFATANLPDPTEHTYGGVFVTDINLGVWAISNGTAWIRSDTGAAI